MRQISVVALMDLEWIGPKGVQIQTVACPQIARVGFWPPEFSHLFGGPRAVCLHIRWCALWGEEACLGVGTILLNNKPQSNWPLIRFPSLFPTERKKSGKRRLGADIPHNPKADGIDTHLCGDHSRQFHVHTFVLCEESDIFPSDKDWICIVCSVGVVLWGRTFCEQTKKSKINKTFFFCFFAHNRNFRFHRN